MFWLVYNKSDLKIRRYSLNNHLSYLGNDIQGFDQSKRNERHASAIGNKRSGSSNEILHNNNNNTE